MKYRIPSLPCFFNDSAQASFFSVPYSTEFLNEFFFFVAVSSAGLRRRPRPLRPRPRPSARRRRRRRPSPTTRCSTCRACTRSSPPAIPSSSRYGYDFGFRSTATSTAFTNRKNGVDIRHQVDQSSYPFLSPTCTSTHRNSSVFLCHRSLTNANVGCPCFLFRSAAPAAAPAAAAAATAADKKSKRTLKGNDHRSFISSDSPEAAYLCVFFACPFFPVVPTPSTDPFSLSDPFAGRVPLKEKFRVAP